MNRIEAPEFMDQPWFPASLRAFETDTIRTLVAIAGVHGVVVDRLEALLRAHREDRVVDLCAGRGGPTPWIARELRARGVHAQFTLTDGWPAPDALEALREADRAPLSYFPEPVHPASVPASLPGVRTMHAAFHHFSDAEATAILVDAVRARAPILVVETTERSLRGVAQVAAMAPILHLLLPLVRPRSLARVALTWGVPVAPLCFTWDAIASSLRTRTQGELEALAARVDLDGAAWRWTTGRDVSWGAPFLWLQGEPLGGA